MEQKKRINLKAISFVLYPSASDPRMNVKAVCNCNCNGNLFTHEALRSSYELVSTCPCVQDKFWIWKCWFLRRRENRSTQRKTSRSKGDNQQQTQPTYGFDTGIWTRTPLVEASALTTVPPSFLLMSGVILILNKQSTSYNEDTDITKLVKENNRQKTRGRLESPCSPHIVNWCGRFYN